MKKALSLLLVLALVLALVPAVFAEGTGDGSLESPYVYESVDALVADWNGRTVDAGVTVYVQAPLGGETLTVTSDTTAACLATTMGASLAFDDESYTFSAEQNPVWTDGCDIIVGIYNQNPRGAAVVTLTAGTGAGEDGGMSSEGTVTYDSWPTWDPSEGYAITPEADGTVTVEVTAADPGYDVCLYNLDADEWGADNYKSEPGTVELAVSAGVNYVVFIYPAVVDGMMSYTTSGSVTYKISFTAAEEGGDEDADTDSNVIADDTATFADASAAYNGMTYEFTPDSNGTVTVEVTSSDPGYYVTYLDSNAGEWGVDNYGTGSGTVEIEVTAGNTYIILVSSAVYYESINCWSPDAGTVTYKITFTSSGEGGEEGGDGGEGTDDPAAGTEENPIIFTQDFYYAANVPAQSTVYYIFDDSSDAFWNGIYEQNYNFVGPTGYTVFIGQQTIDADDYGFVSGSCYGMSGYYSFCITNNTDTDATYYVSFSNKLEYVIDYDHMLQLGENDLTLSTEAPTTIYEFVAEEAGVYSFTVADENALVGYWGAGSFYVYDQTENKTNTLTVTVTDAGQSVMVGVSGVESCILVVAKEAEYVPPVEVEWVDYENTHEFMKDGYVIPEGGEVVAIDVTDDEADVVVLGADGFYHWGTANGPIVVANLYNSTLLDFADAADMQSFRVVYFDEDGNITAKVNYSNAVAEYGGMGLYPVTEELAWILKEIGSAPGFGWYDADVLGTYLFGNAEVDPDTAWLAFCSYVTGTETTDNETVTDPDNGEGPSATGDAMSVAGVIIAMMTSVTGLVVTKKKFF